MQQGNLTFKVDFSLTWNTLILGILFVSEHWSDWAEHSAVEAVYGAIVIEDTFHLPITQIAVLPQKKRGEMFNARRL